jgi:biotin synthase
LWRLPNTTNLEKNKKDLPKRIRVSLGSATIIRLLTCKLDVLPKTVHLMTYNSNKCVANCSFCPQAKHSSSKSLLLSRVSWPEFPTKSVLSKLTQAYLDKIIYRVCIQALNYPGVFIHLEEIIRSIRSFSDIPISVSCQPRTEAEMIRLANAGIDRIGIPIDVATKELFKDIKGKNVAGPYTWESQFSKLITALKIFGKGKVSSHLIVGLGESEKDILRLIQTFSNLGVVSALFAFTPIRGTKLELRSQPSIESYRRIQLAKYLIDKKLVNFDKISFNNNGQIKNFGINKSRIKKIVESGNPFLTSGCPNCNRPFYNEKPSGPLYNYPRKLNIAETVEIKQLLSLEK